MLHTYLGCIYLKATYLKIPLQYYYMFFLSKTFPNCKTSLKELMFVIKVFRCYLITKSRVFVLYVVNI